MKSLLLFGFSCLMMLSSCRKDEVCGNCGPQSVGFVLAGDSASVYGVYTRFQPMLEIIAPWHSGASADVDLNDDGVIDITIATAWMISPGGLNARQTSLSTLNDGVKFRYSWWADTTISWYVTTPFGGITYYENYNNATSYPSNAVMYPLVDSAIARLSFADTIAVSHGDWLSGNFSLAQSNFTSNGTTSSSVVLGNFSNSTPAYVAFKVELADRVDYGWLEMYVTNCSEVHITRKMIFRANL